MRSLRFAVRLGLLLLALITLAAAHGSPRRATPTSCHIHVDDWQPITSDPGQRLVGFRLVAQAAGALGPATLYDFRTDVSNPPSGAYRPSLVRQEFAARCDVVYQLSLQAQDTGDPSFEALGRTNEFRCPMAATLQNYLPFIRR
jgi:hypothetical protein